MKGQTRGDLTSQLNAFHRAQADLSRTLDRASKEARLASRTLSRIRQPDLNDFYAAVAAVRRAEEALDIAHLDYRTASGEDA